MVSRIETKVGIRVKNTYCHECKPYFIGVWDTVASLGHFYGKRFFDAKLHGEIKFGYHAISIDEKRKKFPVNLWDETKKQPKQTIEQVWFAGVHSDVGGWYPQRGLSDSALKWMLLKAKAAGLRLRDGWDSKEKINPDPTHKKSLHESREGFYRLWRKVQRKIPEKALIHQSVFDRINAGIGYNPSNLPQASSIVQWDGGDSCLHEVHCCIDCCGRPTYGGHRSFSTLAASRYQRVHLPPTPPPGPPPGG